MATIINNPRPDERTVVEKTDSSGWIVAVVILVLVIIAAVFLWVHYHRTAYAPAQPGATVNVTLPAGTSNSGNSTGY